MADITDRRGEDNENSLSSLQQYSQSLSDSAKALLKAADEYRKVSEKNQKSLDDSITDLEKVLANFSQSFGKEMKQRQKDAKDNTKDMSEAYEDANIKAKKNNEENLTNAQRVGQAFVKSLSRVADYAVGKFTTAFNNVVSNFESNYSTITMRMDLTNKQYADTLRGMTDTIKGFDLNKQFSQIDWTEKLVTVLDTGIRGQTASDMAFNNMITNKVLPMINTNTKAYTRLSRTLGSGFTEATTAMGRYTEQLYGAIGLEEGRGDQLYNTLEKEILLSAQRAGMTDQQAGDMVASYLKTYQDVANNAGVDASDDFLNAMKDLMQGNTGNLIAMSMMKYLPGADFSDPTMLSRISADQFKEAYYQAYRDFMGSDAQRMSIMANSAGVGGFNYDAASDIMLMGYGRGATGEGGTYKTYDQILNDLADGQGQSKTAQLNKSIENKVANIADTAAQFIPDSGQIISMIYDTIKDWFGVWLAWESADTAGDLLNGNSTNGVANLLRTVGGKVGPKVGQVGSAVSSGLQTGFWSGASSAPGAGALGFMNSTGGAIAGAGGVLAGGAMAIHGGINAVKDFKKGDTGLGIAHTVEGVGGAVGAGALLALGASNPIGWVALAAGAIGLITAKVIEYNKVENVHARAVEASQKNLQEYNDTMSESQKTLEQTKTDYENLRIIQDKSNKDTQEYKSALTALKAQYPEYLGSLRDDQDISEAQIPILEKLIKLKQEEAEIDAYTASKEAYNNVQNVIDSLNSEEELNKKAEEELNAKDSLIDFVSQMRSTYEGAEDASTNSKLKKVIGKENYSRLEELAKEAHKYDENIETEAIDAFRQASGYRRQKMPHGPGVWVLGNSPVYNQENQFDYSGQNTAYESLTSYLSTLSNYKGNYDSLNTTQKSTVSYTLKTIDELWDSLVDSGVVSGEDLKNMLYESTGVHSSELSDIYEMTHSFRKGLNSVPCDNYPILAHEGEMVLTKPTAQLVRELAGGESTGIRSLFTNLKREATATPLEEATNTVTVNAIVDVIKEQTMTLASILNDILSAVKGIGTNESNPEMNRALSDALISYVGY